MHLVRGLWLERPEAAGCLAVTLSATPARSGQGSQARRGCRAACTVGPTSVPGADHSCAVNPSRACHCAPCPTLDINCQGHLGYTRERRSDSRSNSSAALISTEKTSASSDYIGDPAGRMRCPGRTAGKDAAGPGRERREPRWRAAGGVASSSLYPLPEGTWQPSRRLTLFTGRAAPQNPRSVARWNQSLHAWPEIHPQTIEPTQHDRHHVEPRRRRVGSSSVPVSALPKALARSDTYTTCSPDCEGRRAAPLSLLTQPTEGMNNQVDHAWRLVNERGVRHALGTGTTEFLTWMGQRTIHHGKGPADGGALVLREIAAEHAVPPSG